MSTATAAVIPFVVPTPAAAEPDAAESKRRIINDRSLQGLKAPEKDSTEYVDVHAKGLRLVITAANVRTWSFRYVNPQGKPKRLAIGRLKDFTLKAAREKVSEFRKLLEKGIDPANVRVERRTALTFGQLLGEWKEKHASKLKTKAEDEIIAVERELASWMDRPAEDITKQDVIAMHDAKTAEGFNAAADSLRSTVSRIYNFGMKRDLVTKNPVKTTDRNERGVGKRVLTEDEIVRVWQACDALPLHQAVWMKLRLVTGQRGGELLKMQRTAVTPSGWWTIDEKFTKNGQTHRVFLSTLARELLATLPQRPEDGPYDPVWVFPAQGHNTASLNVMGGDVTAIAQWLCHPERANVVIALDAPSKRPGWRKHFKPGFRGHDLRRTMSTFCTTAKVPRALIGKVLNHTSRKTEARADTTVIYDCYEYDEEKEQIAIFWERLLRCILAGKSIKEAGKFTTGVDEAALKASVNAAIQATLHAVRAILATETLSDTARAALDALQAQMQAS